MPFFQDTKFHFMNLKLHSKNNFFSLLYCACYKGYHSTCIYQELLNMQA